MFSKKRCFQTLPILSKHIQSTVLMNVIQLSTLQHSNNTIFKFKSIFLPSFEVNRIYPLNTVKHNCLVKILVTGSLILYSFRQHVSVVKRPSSGLQWNKNAMCETLRMFRTQLCLTVLSEYILPSTTEWKALNNRMLSISDPPKSGYMCYLSIFVRLSELSTPNEFTSKHYETHKFVPQWAQY